MVPTLLVVPGRHRQQPCEKLTSIGSSPVHNAWSDQMRRWLHLAISLARKDRQAVGNRALRTIISSISDKRNLLVELPDRDHDRGTNLHRDHQTTCMSQVPALQVIH